jgi:hypothetical protein
MGLTWIERRVYFAPGFRLYLLTMLGSSWHQCGAAAIGPSVFASVLTPVLAPVFAPEFASVLAPVSAPVSAPLLVSEFAIMFAAVLSPAFPVF